MPEVPKRPRATIRIEWDPNTGEIGYNASGCHPMEEIGAIHMALAIRMDALRKPNGADRLVLAPGPLPSIRN
jgi:hypothetical protein